MNFIKIGKIVKPHGIKGELRILSSFPYKDRVFVVGNKLKIEEKEYVITSYRVHKGFDMVTFEGYTNINDILFLVNRDVYFDKDLLSLSSNEILDEDLISYEVLTNDGRRGIIKEIFYASENNKILRIQMDKEVLVPWNSPMIVKIDKEKKEVIIELIEGM